MPIQDLLHRIRWDAEFAAGEFVIGYFDRVKQDIVRLPLQTISFSGDDRYDFQFQDEHGEQHSVPLHRIKEVYRRGKLIWHREH